MSKLLQDFINVALEALKTTKGAGPYSFEDVRWRLQVEVNHRKGAGPYRFEEEKHTYTLAELESVSAVTAEFFSDKKQATDFYEKYGDQISGMVGVWQYVRDAAITLERESATYGEAGEDYDWLLVVEDFAAGLYLYQNSPKELANTVLTKHSYDKKPGVRKG